MKIMLNALLGALRAEIAQMGRSKLLLVLTAMQSVIFILLLSIFGLTGSRAPTAVVDKDGGKYSGAFIDCLKRAHNSFSIRLMDEKTAEAEVSRGDLVSMIKIPRDFSQEIALYKNVFIDVTIDNVDVDMTEDIQRAIPSAIVKFSDTVKLPGIRVRVSEDDLIDHDTDFIPYLAVSALALAAFVVAGILGASAVSREFEAGTIKLLKLAPVPPLVTIIGRIIAAGLYSLTVLIISVGVIVIGYGIKPAHPVELSFALVICVIIFGCAGAALGAVFKRTLTSASLIFGLALPFYIDSGALEPERFDGNAIWALAHLSPVYYAVGILEHAFHGFLVTPESVFVDFIALGIWAIVLLIITAKIMKRKILLW